MKESETAAVGETPGASGLRIKKVTNRKESKNAAIEEATALRIQVSDRHESIPKLLPLGRPQVQAASDSKLDMI